MQYSRKLGLYRIAFALIAGLTALTLVNACNKMKRGPRIKGGEATVLPQRYSVRILPGLMENNSGSRANSINKHNIVVGHSNFDDNGRVYSRATLWKDFKPLHLGSFAGESGAVDINDD